MNHSTRKIADWLPLVILYITAGYLLWACFDGQALLQWKHWVGFIMLMITTILFLVNHKLGVLCTGFTIILGLLGLLSFSTAINTTSVGKTFGGTAITLLRFQPVFIIWALIHVVVSGRYYTGIATPAYWSNIRSDEPFKME